MIPPSISSLTRNTEGDIIVPIVRLDPPRLNVDPELLRRQPRLSIPQQVLDTITECVTVPMQYVDGPTVEVCILSDLRKLAIFTLQLGIGTW